MQQKHHPNIHNSYKNGNAARTRIASFLICLFSQLPSITLNNYQFLRKYSLIIVEATYIEAHYISSFTIPQQEGYSLPPPNPWKNPKMNLVTLHPKQQFPSFAQECLQPHLASPSSFPRRYQKDCNYLLGNNWPILMSLSNLASSPLMMAISNSVSMATLEQTTDNPSGPLPFPTTSTLEFLATCLLCKKSMICG